jgi:hypothetical protein
MDKLDKWSDDMKISLEKKRSEKRQFLFFAQDDIDERKLDYGY